MYPSAGVATLDIIMYISCPPPGAHRLPQHTGSSRHRHKSRQTRKLKGRTPLALRPTSYIITASLLVHADTGGTPCVFNLRPEAALFWPVPHNYKVDGSRSHPRHTTTTPVTCVARWCPCWRTDQTLQSQGE